MPKSKTCPVCGSKLDGHPRRKFCDKKECQKVRIKLAKKSYYQRIKKSK